MKLLALSLARHCPGIELRVYAPAFPAAFEQWAQGHPMLRLLPTQPGWPRAWRIKPTVLLDCLDAGHETAVWFDADIVLAGHVQSIWAALARGALVVATEIPWPAGGDGSAERTVAFDL
ncbi:MAG: hypothetical protein ACKOEC_08675 [Acidimicrobiia bacterium]